MNLSKFNNEQTAKTNSQSAHQRAENLAILGAKNVLELCVGPSLKELEKHYNNFGIKVTGNDIDPRWKKYYQKGNWIIGDALSIDYSPFDFVVFAPPLSKGCSGRREDSLSIDNVFPTYSSFVNVIKNYKCNFVLVLPGRSMATSNDRKQLYNIISSFNKVDLIPLTSGHKNIIKYYDLIVSS